MSADPLDRSTFLEYSGNPSSIPCPKCGSDNFYTYWASEALVLCSNGQLNSIENYTGPDNPGFLIRQCTVCTHSRGETTLDDGEQPLTAAKATKDNRTIQVNQLPSPTENGPLYFVK